MNYKIPKQNYDLKNNVCTKIFFMMWALQVP